MCSGLLPANKKTLANAILCALYARGRIIALTIPFTVLLTPGIAHADNYFNPAFLTGDASAVADLSRFEKGEGQAAGTYRVDVSVNETFLFSKDVEFKPAGEDGKGELTPYLTSSMLDELGVNLASFPELKMLKADEKVSLVKAIPDAHADFDFEKQTLHISLPQASMKQSARGYIPPERWDQGINALLLNYDFNGSNSNSLGSKESDNFLNLQSGLNFWGLRIRDYSTWSKSGNDDGAGKWQHVSTYAQHTIIPLRAEMVMGDSYTPSEVFDSLAFRGVQVSSDDNMLPDSLRGFAPTVRGIAKSNAQVSVKQNGYIIYQSYVSAGAFEINDLFPTSSSGDLTVMVKESDGSENSYTVPYSAVPLLQRENHVKYAVMYGRFRSNDDQQDDPVFGQGTLMWGLSHGITVYGGTQYSANYHAMALGLGFNLGNFGAVSFDATQARSMLADDTEHKGQSFRFLYAKSLNSVGTNFQLLGYRYSTEGFYTLDETAYHHMSGQSEIESSDDDENKNDNKNSIAGSYYNLYYNKRGKVQINISQQLGDFGSLYVTGSEQSYWHMSDTDRLLQFGYNSSWKEVTFGLSLSYNRSAGQSDTDRVIALSLSLPLSSWLAGGESTPGSQGHYSTLNFNTSQDSSGRVNTTTGLSGTLLEGNNLSYSVQDGYANQGEGNSGSVSLGYQGTYGNLRTGYNYSAGYKQMNYGASGGMVLHANGLTLSQPLGDTNILIKAPGAAGVAVENATGVKTDWRGYAVVPYATTYRQNRVALNTSSLGDHVDVDNAVVDVVPTQGALVRADFNAHVGLRVLMGLLHHNKPVPFGAIVALGSDENDSSIVADDGQVYLSGLPLTGKLNVQWGEGADQKCTVNYQLPESEMTKTLSRVSEVCS